jgi:hypothetical protein
MCNHSFLLIEEMEVITEDGTEITEIYECRHCPKIEARPKEERI